MLNAGNSSQRLIYFAVVVACCLTVAYFSIGHLFHLRNPFAAPPSAQEHVDPAHQKDLDSSLVSPVVHQETFKYARRFVRVRQGAEPDKFALPKMEESLKPKFEEVTIANLLTEDFRNRKDDVLTLDVPRPEYEEQEEWRIMFGLSSTVERLEASFSHMKHWLPRPGVTMLVVAPPSPNTSKVLKKWRGTGIDITIIESKADFVDRLVSLFKEMHDHSKTLKSPTRWFAIADDDTFFPSIERLRAGLNAYDHQRPFWIGALSEATDRVEKHGYIAFGGAGMFFSEPLLAQISPHVVECTMDADDKEYGDKVLAFCIESHSRTRLTSLRGLHQLDLFGDASGVYESGFKPLSLHHWEKKRWGPLSHDIPMDKVALVAGVTGDEGMFQRWRFADGWVLTNGYSLVKYSTSSNVGERLGGIGDSGDDRIEFDKMEFTWDGPERYFKQSLGPFRRKLSSQEKKSWVFVDAAVQSGSGSVRQVYVRKDDAGMLEVFELVWLKN